MTTPYRGEAGQGSQAEGWRLVVRAEGDDREPVIWQIHTPDGSELITTADPSALLVALMEFTVAESVSLVDET